MVAAPGFRGAPLVAVLLVHVCGAAVGQVLRVAGGVVCDLVLAFLVELAVAAGVPDAGACGGHGPHVVALRDIERGKHGLVRFFLRPGVRVPEIHELDQRVGVLHGRTDHDRAVAREEPFVQHPRLAPGADVPVVVDFLVIAVDAGMAADQAGIADMPQDRHAVPDAVEEHCACLVFLAGERAFAFAAPEGLHRTDETVGQVGDVVVHVSVLAAGDARRNQRGKDEEAAGIVPAEPLRPAEMQIAFDGDVDVDAEERDFQVCFREVAVDVRVVEYQADEVGEELGRADPLAGTPAVFGVQGGRRIGDRLAHREFPVVQPRFVFARRVDVQEVAQHVAQHVRNGVSDEVHALLHEAHVGGGCIPECGGAAGPALFFVERAAVRGIIAFRPGVFIDLLEAVFQVFAVVDAARRPTAASAAGGSSAQVALDHIGQVARDVHEVEQVVAAPDCAVFVRFPVRDEPGVVFVQVGVLVDALDAGHALVADHGGAMEFLGLLERDAAQFGVIGVVLVVAVEGFSADEPLVQAGGQAVGAQDREMLRQGF